jgi:hypothetical protein
MGENPRLDGVGRNAAVAVNDDIGDQILLGPAARTQKYDEPEQQAGNEILQSPLPSSPTPCIRWRCRVRRRTEPALARDRDIRMRAKENRYYLSYRELGKPQLYGRPRGTVQVSAYSFYGLLDEGVGVANSTSTKTE